MDRAERVSGATRAPVQEGSWRFGGAWVEAETGISSKGNFGACGCHPRSRMLRVVDDRIDNDRIFDLGAVPGPDQWTRAQP